MHNLKKCEDAIKCYDEALAINPTYPDCLNNKGVALFLLNKYQEALECHDKALAINPNSAHGIYNKANVLRHLNQPPANTAGAAAAPATS